MLVAIACNKFVSENLYRLQFNIIVSEDEKEYFLIIESSEEIKCKKTVSQLSFFDNTLKIWFITFLNYTRILTEFFMIRASDLLIDLLKFHVRIVKLIKTYKWQETVLLLTVWHHQNHINNNTLNCKAWHLLSDLIDKYMRGHIYTSLNLSCFKLEDQQITKHSENSNDDFVYYNV